LHTQRSLWAVLIHGLAIGLLLAGCAPTPPTPTLPPTPALSEASLERLEVDHYPQFADTGDPGALLRSIEMSLAYLGKQPADKLIHFGADPYPVSHIIASLKAFARIMAAKPSPMELNQVIRDKFYVYQSVGRTGNHDVLFTGYYEPILKARRTPTAAFRIPVHSKPSDMVEIDLSQFAADLKGRTIVGRYTGKTVVPYPTRKEIRRKPNFNTMAPPIAWLQNEIDLFILQIQGSGRVALEDGTQMHILYAGSNGRPYRSIGRLLIEEGRIARKNMSMQAIRAYLNQHAEITTKILDHNPRYIFFKTAPEGPLGALGQPLTPMRSLAVDRKVMPSAALAFIVTPLPHVSPQGTVEGWQPYRGFAMAQDAGSAIKGPGRIDLFMGNGRQAEAGAGRLKHSGLLYFLILKPANPAPQL